MLKRFLLAFKFYIYLLFVYNLKGTLNLRIEAYNQDLVMWMCFEGEVQFS